MKHILSVLFLSVIAFQAFGQEVETFENPDKKYTIDFPKGWDVGYDKNAVGTYLIAIDPANTVNRISLITTKSMVSSTEQNFKNFIRELKKDNTNVIGEEGVTEINGMEARWGIYSVVDKKTKDPLVKVKVYVIKGKKDLFNIQAILKADAYDASIEGFEKIISTFKPI